MKKKPLSCCTSCEENDQPNGERRKFLQSAAVAVSSIALGLSTAAQADAPAAENGELLMALPAQVLEKVGGFEVIETADDKVIVARTGPTSIVACSAICTHKGCTVGYEHESGQFVCPCHGARYETTGKVVKGPAKRDLKSYKTRPVLGLSTPSDKA
jgi:cytochrome b6-f complex iron-sulfur subunit